MAIAVQNSFNSGELTPKMFGRPDLEVYKSGCSWLENFYVLPQGGVERRQGSEFIDYTNEDDVSEGTTKARMIPFVFSSAEAYAMEFGDGYIKVWLSDGTNVDVTGTVPYAEADIRQIQYTAPRFDTMYLSHPNYPVQVLKRTSISPAFTIEEVEFSYPATLERNDTGISMECSATTGDITMTASEAYFESDMLGAYFVLEHERTVGASWESGLGTGGISEEVDVSGNFWGASWAGSYVGTSYGTATLEQKIGAGAWTTVVATSQLWTYSSTSAAVANTLVRIVNVTLSGKGKITNDGASSINGTLTGDGTTAILDVSFSNWSVSTGGTWNGRAIVERKVDTGLWQELTTLADSTGIDPTNASYSSPSKEGKNTQIRIRYTGNTGFKYNIRSDNSFEVGLLKVTGYTSTTEVDATIVSDIGNISPTLKWYEGAFSTYRGFPTSITFHENRLWLAGTEYDPSTIFASVSGDYENFITGSVSDLGIKRIPDTPSTARWLSSRQTLLFGTDGGTIGISSADKNGLITAANIRTPSQNVYGSSDIQGIKASDVVLYLQNNNLKLRELIYNFDEDNYRSNDITILNDLILESGVAELFLQSQPDQIVWNVKENGDVALLTYERQQEVVGWARYTTNGTVISACAVPTATGEDALWQCVERNGKYLIEKLGARIDLDLFVDSSVLEQDAVAVSADSVAIGAASTYIITVTKTGHGFTGNEVIKISNAVNFDWLNGKVVEVGNVSGADFDLHILGTNDPINANTAGYTSGTVTLDYEVVSNTISGLDHLEGLDLQVVADDTYLNDYTVVSGIITLDDYFNKRLAGLQYESKLRPMPIEPALANRLSNTRVKGSVKGDLKFYKTIGAKFGEYGKQGTSLPALETTDLAGQALAPQTGEYNFVIANDWQREKILEVSQSLPYPMTVLSMAIWAEVKGG